MKLMHAVGIGFFLLILTYLGVKNGPAVTSIFNAGGVQGVNLTKALQGR